MSGTLTYHDVPQPYRIQKRLALNRSFRAIYECASSASSLVYVTLGGEDIYDLMDLLGVFDIGSLCLDAVSYEQDQAKAEKAENGPVARTLRRIASVSVRVWNLEFPSQLDRLVELRHRGPFIYFLDYTGTFSLRQGEAVAELLSQGLMCAGDFLLITSCLSPRIVHQGDFMLPQLSKYRLLWPEKRIDHKFRVRNHVELFLAGALDAYRKLGRATGKQPLALRQLRKFRYRDSRAPMGLWAYAIEPASSDNTILDDVEFDDFPEAFQWVPEEPLDLPDLFGALLTPRTTPPPKHRRR